VTEYTILGEPNEFLESLAQASGFHTEDGELSVEFWPLEDSDPFGPAPGTPLHKTPSAYNNSAVDVEMPLEDFKDLQAYIAVELEQLDGSALMEWQFWDAADDTRVAELTSILMGKTEPADFASDGVPMPFVVFSPEGRLTNIQEGRHRALAAEKAGLSTVPVRLYLDTNKGSRGKVDVEPGPGGPDLYDPTEEFGGLP